MPDPFTDGEDELQRAEHISPRKTGDNISAKRVATYVWNSTTSEWERMTQPGGGGVDFDYIDIQQTSATVETYVYKQGGVSGTTVQTITVTYTAADKENLDKVEYA